MNLLLNFGELQIGWGMFLQYNSCTICILLFSGDPVMCLSFAYHMYGSNIGSLDVIFDNATYFYEYDNKGNQWKQAKIDLAAPESSASSVWVLSVSIRNGI